MKKLLLASGLAAIFFSSAVFASFISLNTTLTSKLENGSLKLEIQAVNKGDESAFNVQAEVAVGGKSFLSAKTPELKIDEVYTAKLTVPLALKKPGTYPLILTMHYTDANQYPFSALTSQLFVNRQDVVPPVFGQLRPVTFAKEGKVKLVMKNLSDQPIKVQTRLVTPRELTVAESKLELAIGPKSEAKGSFLAQNFSALGGSTYQIFAVSEAEDEAAHYTNITPGTIKIVANDSYFGFNYTVLFILLVLLVVVFIAAQLFRK